MSSESIPFLNSGSFIYEVNTRQYSASGHLQALLEHLPRLAAMHAGVLWLMPLHPTGITGRKGSLGSYYSVRDYLSIDPAYGNMADLIRLIEKAHALGMKVILDWVANHTAWDHAWINTRPDFYSRDAAGNIRAPFPEWEDVAQLDYGNPDLWEEMIRAMQFWPDQADIDGFRCDMANLVPTAFWKAAIRRLGENKTLFWLAEAEDPALPDAGFHVLYQWKLLHAMDGFIHSEGNAARLDREVVGELSNPIPGRSTMLFTSNHDENSWKGSAIERLGASLEACICLTFTLPGIPLVYGGQEAGLAKRLMFFDKDLIPWKEDKLEKRISRLAQLRLEHPALWPGSAFRRIPNSAGSDVFTFCREKNGNRVLVMLNLSWHERSFTLENYLSDGLYTEAISMESIHAVQGARWTLGPWQWMIMTK